MLQDLSDWAADIVEQLGYLGVVLLVAIENLVTAVMGGPVEGG